MYRKSWRFCDSTWVYLHFKLFVGNVDRDTKVVNWFKVRLFARYIKIKPNSWNGTICMRTEIIGCHTGIIHLRICHWFVIEALFVLTKREDHAILRVKLLYGSLYFSYKKNGNYEYPLMFFLSHPWLSLFWQYCTVPIPFNCCHFWHCNMQWYILIIWHTYSFVVFVDRIISWVFHSVIC